MSTKEPNDCVLGPLADKLKLQAHLAKMELADPSEHESGVHKEASALAQMRDDFRLQMHLGKLEAKEEWLDAEERWSHFIQRSVKPTAKGLAEGAQETTHEVLGRIRHAYTVLVAQ
jgi:hypothetical protein